VVFFFTISPAAGAAGELKQHKKEPNMAKRENEGKKERKQKKERKEDKEKTIRGSYY
jgi:ribosomal protein L12E/L44/L45/RPP1/RPP2